MATWCLCRCSISWKRRLLTSHAVSYRLSEGMRMTWRTALRACGPLPLHIEHRRKHDVGVAAGRRGTRA